MGFAEPLAWWLTLLAPVIVLLHSLKMRRARVVVPSILLWTDAPEDVRANAPFRRARRDWVMFLQLAALLFAVTALARPYLTVAGGSAARVVIVLDGSASMNATDVSPTRFDAARRAATDYADGLPRQARVAVVLAGRTPELALPFTGDKGTIRAALNGLSPTDSAGNVAAALELADAISSGISTEIHLFTDAPPDESDGSTVHLFGEPLRNVAVEAVAARRSTPSTAYNVTTRLRNDQPDAATVEATLWVNDAPQDVRPVELPLNGAVSVSFEGEVDARTDATVRVTLNADDAFPTDNAAYAVLPAVSPLRVLIVGGQNPYRDLQFRLQPNVLVEMVAPERYLPRDDVHLTVFDGETPDSLPNGDALLIDPRGALPFAERVGTTTAAAPTWDASHPLMRFVPLDTVAFTEIGAYRLTDDAQRLAAIGETALIALWESPKSRVVLLAFDAFAFQRTDFALNVASVVFVSNVVEWARNGRRLAPESSVAGEPVRLRSRDDASYIARLPNGQAAEIRDGAFTPDLAGIVTLERDGVPYERIAVNVSEPESRRVSEPVATTTVSTAASDTHRRDLWRWFALAALAAISTEWWVFHRRT
ncbi:MAG: BatA and WFA domain-containing protein [Candidatus Poribacteria bacterium]|nr:BatA and WFA domain-containing protein [Candidatus Poribacteria bacterium]